MGVVVPMVVEKAEGDEVVLIITVAFRVNVTVVTPPGTVTFAVYDS